MAGQIIPAIIGGAKVLSKIPAVKESAKAIAKALKRRKRKQDKKKNKSKQEDMFSEELKDATEARKVKEVKKSKDAMRRKWKDPEVEDGVTQKDLDRLIKEETYGKTKLAAGGPVKKCKVDGIATKGFTRAKHK